MGDVLKKNTVWKSTGDKRNPLNATHSGRGLNRLVFWFEVDLDAMVEKKMKIELTKNTIENVVRLILEDKSLAQSIITDIYYISILNICIQVPQNPIS